MELNKKIQKVIEACHCRIELLPKSSLSNLFETHVHGYVFIINLDQGSQTQQFHIHKIKFIFHFHENMHEETTRANMLKFITEL